MIRPLRGRAAFAAFRRAATGRCGAIRARFVRSSIDGDETAVAYALTRKVGNAVTRNRIRRRLRAAMVELGRRGALRPGGNYLLSAGPEAVDCSYPELARWLEGAVDRAHAAAEGGSR